MKYFQKDFKTALKVGISVVLLVLLTAFIHYYIIPDGIVSLIISTFFAGIIWFYVRKELKLLTVWG
jgi:hypothetical protein